MPRLSSYWEKKAHTTVVHKPTHSECFPIDFMIFLVKQHYQCSMGTSLYKCYFFSWNCCLRWGFTECALARVQSSLFLSSVRQRLNLLTPQMPKFAGNPCLAAIAAEADEMRCNFADNHSVDGHFAPHTSLTFIGGARAKCNVSTRVRQWAASWPAIYGQIAKNIVACMKYKTREPFLPEILWGHVALHQCHSPSIYTIWLPCCTTMTP